MFGTLSCKHIWPFLMPFTLGISYQWERKKMLALIFLLYLLGILTLHLKPCRTCSFIFLVPFLLANPTTKLGLYSLFISRSILLIMIKYNLDNIYHIHSSSWLHDKKIKIIQFFQKKILKWQIFNGQLSRLCKDNWNYT